MSVRMTVYAYTTELERVRKFYGRALEIEPAFRAGNWLPFKLAGGIFALHAAGSDAAADIRGFKLSFEVDDIEIAIVRWEAQGAQVLRGVADEAFGRRAFLADPDGRQVEIVQHEAP
ncbi:MAG: hypothetical protein IH958_00045 [Chloroflexi bacterium]|nr:hypothetical protein [Chloroflexota bacterium]